MPLSTTSAPSLFIGIDVSKKTHIAGFLSEKLLEERKRPTSCPTFSFAQSRKGIDSFLKAIHSYGGTLEGTAILLEQTGHYHRALQESLQAEGLQVFIIAIHQKKVNGLDKSDKRDALRLANMLYSQLHLHAQVDDSTQRIERRLPPIPAAAALAPLVRLHYETAQEITRLSNKLTALNDEIFPEFVEVIRGPNGAGALNIRERFPTPAHLAQASLAQLRQCRTRSLPGDADFLRLQEVARISIGVQEKHRLHGLTLEQSQLIERLRLLNNHLAHIDQEIKQIVAVSREGQILLSLPALGFLDVAVILSALGNIRNFEKASQLRRFCGWSPQAHQTGTSYDQSDQTHTGSRMIKQELYLIAMRAVKDEPWKSFYTRLVEKNCSYDARLGRHRGKNRVIGRVAGTIITMVFRFLKEDADVVDSTPTGELQPPKLYSAAIHEAHRRGARIQVSA